MIAWLFELVTGRPYWTSRSMAAEFGPTLATLYPEEIAQLSDAELYALTPAELRERLERQHNHR